MILLRSMHKSTSDAFLALLFAMGKSLSAEARKQTLANTDGAGPSCQKESIVPTVGPSNFKLSPPFAPPLLPITTPPPPAVTNGGGGKGKKRAFLESPDRKELIQ
jgi:hypothetical protein